MFTFSESTPRITFLFFLLALALPAFGQDYFQLRSRISSNGNVKEYLHTENGPPSVGQVQPGWWSKDWTIEKTGDGHIRLKSRHLNGYLHNEKGPLEVSPASKGWWSAMWKIEKVMDGDGFYRLKNRHTGAYLTANNGQLTLGNGSNTAYNTMWDIYGYELKMEPAVQREFLGSVRPRTAAPVSTNQSMRITNRSMWDVSFRVKSGGSWSDWKYANISANPKEVSIRAGGKIQSYEVMWKDVSKWKHMPGGSPIIPSSGDLSTEIVGNTFSGIKFK